MFGALKRQFPWGVDHAWSVVSAVENSQQIPYFEDPGVGAQNKNRFNLGFSGHQAARPFCFGEVRAARATVFICFGGWHLDVFLDASLDETCDFAPWLLATPAAGADHGNSSSPSALLQLCPGRQDGPWQLGEGFQGISLDFTKIRCNDG